MPARERRTRRATVAPVIGFAMLALTVGACGDRDDEAARAARGPNPLLSAPRIVHMQSLSRAAGDTPYVVDRSITVEQMGRLSALVRAEGDLPPDTLVRPTHDAPTCAAVPDAPFVGTREGVGDAVAWLVGVRRGPEDPAPRRVTIALAGCQIEPRISRAPLGATLLVRSADALDARLRFLDVMDDRSTRTTGDSTPAALVVSPMAPRALVPLFDAGAVVPLTAVTDAPGLVEVRDDRHPWVHGWIAVAPHPYVAISDRLGRISFDQVPIGRYVLVTWHERLGTVATDVRVERGVETRVTITLPVTP